MNKSFRILFFAFFLLAHICNAFSQDFFSESSISQKKALKIINDKVFFNKGNVFVIGEFIDQYRIKEIGKVNLNSEIYGIEVANDHAYVSLGRNGFCVINIESKENPFEVNRNPMARSFDIDVDRNYAYVAGGLEGLKIFDVRDPSNPKQTGFLVQWDDIYKIFVQGRFAYASSPNAGIKIIDVFDPIDPRQVGIINIPSKSPIVKVDGNYIYIAEVNNGLQIYDISLPSNPVKVGGLDLENAADLFVLGDIVYVSDSESTLSLIDVQDVSNPLILDEYDTKDQGNGIYVRHNYAFFADGEKSVTVVKLKDYQAIAASSVGKPELEKIELVKQETVKIEPDTTKVEKEKMETGTKPPAEVVSTNWEKIERYAVIIGVSDYKYPQIPSLDFADKDAIEFYRFLVSPQGGRFKEENVMLLLNENATTQNIKDALFIFLKEPLKEDIVYIYFSGHGAPESGNDDNMYLITHDTVPNKVSSTAFPMWDIQTSLERHISAEKVIIITDACHSGRVGEEMKTKSIEDQNLVNRYLKELSKSGPGKVSFTASGSGELSRESVKWGGGHGVFTYFLLEGLKGSADKDDNNVITIGEIIEYTEKNVRRETKSAQNPDVAGKFDINMAISILLNKK